MTKCNDDFVAVLLFALSLQQIAPPGLKHVQTFSCGACSNENAIKLVFMAYMVIIYDLFIYNLVYFFNSLEACYKFPSRNTFIEYVKNCNKMTLPYIKMSICVKPKETGNSR